MMNEKKKFFFIVFLSLATSAALGTPALVVVSFVTENTRICPTGNNARGDDALNVIVIALARPI